MALAALLAGCSAESITQAQATEIALEHAGVTQEEASSLSVQQDTTEEGRKVYEIDFSTQDTEYHYDVARNNGEIINYHYDTASAASSGEAQGMMARNPAQPPRRPPRAVPVLSKRRRDYRG